MKKLKGKRIIVTGGSKGIGKGISKVLLKEGASVLICGRMSTDLVLAHSELSNYGECYYVRADLSSKEDVKVLFEVVKTLWGSLDVLINNASILGLRTKLENYPEDLWDQVIQVNLNAQFYITKALIPLLKSTQSEEASIINVSSSVGREPREMWGAYSVSKAALEAMTKILAQELQSSNIRVNSVNPGGTRTNMRAQAYPEEDPSSLPTPEDIAPVFVYLASDDSIGITGKEFNARDWLSSKESN